MKKKRILVTGDSVVRINNLKEVFKEEFYEVVNKVLTSDITAELNNENVDLLIVNLERSIFDEFELVKMIRNDYTKDLLPIIVINDNADIGEKIEFLSMGVDDYLYYPFNEQELYFRTINLLKRVSRNRDVNPLTGLSGNVEIQSQISDNIDSGELFGILYCDLDNFKAYNDVYGFENGDRVIKKVADVLNNVVGHYGGDTDFIGHIGGDDFVVITSPERMDAMGSKIAEEFSKDILNFYNPDDRKNGYITAKGRDGTVKQFPIMSISVAGVTNEVRRLICPAQVAEIAAEVKKLAKSIAGSSYVKDRRGN
ncbi:MAG: diguanylate cyclase [Clostridia bacterium]|nr:diguanylate cyclase [Clostridia bacterium]